MTLPREPLTQRCPHCNEALQYTATPPRFCSSCGRSLRLSSEDVTQPYAPPTTAPHAASEPSPPPASVGGYRLVRPLGEGGMGAVYEGEDAATGRRVAVKLIRAEFADSADAVERFRREGRLASTIAHPRCVFVLAADEEAGRPYIVMELMPGVTLADLVEKSGPLPPREAVGRILDVIEGLQEAHRCGLIHRDVKPSNCFVDAEGRVKVGDFGLSKALVPDARLTHTGAFLGTLLYAAPEQIRNEVVDQQADVYSVAATLYFLLTGRAPFQTDDAAATLARTMTDRVTPLRKLRPDVPTTLDDVVLRGLARDRGKRWKDLEDFRVALLPFVPGRHSLAEVGWRVAAYLLDTAFIAFAEFVLIFLFYLAVRPVLTAQQHGLLQLALSASVYVLLVLLYFGVPESVWGGSPGKLLLRLRVRTVPGNDRPGLPRAAGRTLLFVLLHTGVTWVLQLVARAPLLLGAREPPLAFGLLSGFAPLIGWVAGTALIASTMRRRNGYRALHDVLSGTVVIRLPERRQPRLLSTAVYQPPPTPMPPDVPPRLGAFTVRGLVCAAGRWRLLLGEDGALNRRVWLWLRPAEEGELSAPRREVSRTTRPRWLAGGRTGDDRWDAFVASPGVPLSAALRGRPRRLWPEALPVLEQLADELAATSADGTLPRSLGVEQVWVETTGRVQLLDTPPEPPATPPADADPDRRALGLLRLAAAHLLEGRARAPGDGGPVRAPLPGPAADALRRLMAANGYATAAEFRAALETAREGPAEVTRGRRAVQLTLLGLALGGGVAWMLYVSIMITMLAYMSALVDELRCELALDTLRAASPRDFAVLTSTPDPMLALAAVAQEDADRRQAARLEEDCRGFREDRADPLRSCSWFTHAALSVVEENRAALKEHPVVRASFYQNAAGEREAIDRAEAWKPHTLSHEGMADMVPVFAGMLLAFPVGWVVWAAATRGGLSLWLAGLRLVQADGRRAARWRCVWRALLVWAPFAGLLLASLTVEGWRLLEGAASQDAAAWLSWGTWWLAVLLLPTYVWLALRVPHRALHDRLAGTYLVPR
jgi:tRNA A-37 threonylcarbamoyl transferase component Bud32